MLWKFAQVEVRIVKVSQLPYIRDQKRKRATKKRKYKKKKYKKEKIQKKRKYKKGYGLVFYAPMPSLPH